MGNHHRHYRTIAVLTASIAIVAALAGDFVLAALHLAVSAVYWHNAGADEGDGRR